MVSERAHLRLLQVGECGHNDVGMLLGMTSQVTGECVKLVDPPGGRSLQIEAEVESDLIVPGPGSVKLACHLSDPLGQAPLHRGVHVFIPVDELELPGDGRAPKPMETGQNRFGLFLVDDAGLPQHRGVGD